MGSLFRLGLGLGLLWLGRLWLGIVYSAYGTLGWALWYPSSIQIIFRSSKQNLAFEKLSLYYLHSRLIAMHIMNIHSLNTREVDRLDTLIVSVKIPVMSSCHVRVDISHIHLQTLLTH